MKTITIINLVLFIPTLVLQVLAILLSSVDTIAFNDIIIILASICGIIISIINLTVIRHHLTTNFISLALSVFILVILFQQTKYFYNYYNAGRGNYSLYFTFWYAICLLGVFAFIVVALRHILRLRTTKQK